MLAVVEDEQRVFAPQIVRNGVDRRPISGRAERGDHHVGHERGVRDARKFDKPYAVSETIEQLRSDLQRQARFSDTAGADEREQSRLREQLPDFFEIAFAAAKTRRLEGQIVGARIQ